MPTQMEIRASNAYKDLKVVYDSDDRWAAMELLPLPVRYMLAHAPFDYATIDIAKDYHAWYEEASYGDPFTFFTRGPSNPDVWEYVANMDAAFRRDVIKNDYTGTHQDGSYKLVPKIHAHSASKHKDVLRSRSRRAGRRSFFFPPIPTGPERAPNFRGEELSRG